MDTTTTSESQAAASPLPVELLAIILKQVQSRKDHISFSAASKLLRDIALPGLFETVYVYSNDRWDRKLGQLENADEKIRTLIRYVRSLLDPAR
ncbi:hypothetical protein PLICRDRAFT_37286 [Plicaturopsis crispa FD-325 SS-3]|nr:hypothetical protein PLICRDRAFT_37286 [Plicaturopsis crispa FD-325 SS-3]